MIIDELIALLGYKVEGEDDLKRFNKGLDQLEKNAYAVGQAIGTFAAVAGAAVAGGMALLGASVLKTAAQFESYEATLTTIEGSSEKAKKSLDWISDFATTTPYEVSELTEAFVKLRSYGLDPLDGTMVVIGNTASAMGKSLDQAVEAWADATTGEFERLKEFGIRSKQAGDSVTFTWSEAGKDVSKTVKKTSKDISKFLSDTLGKRFDGAMVRQSKTWNGMVSNLGDTWTSFQRRIADSGFFDAVKNRLADFMDVLGRWASDGTLDKVAKMLGDAFTAAADAIGIVFGRIAEHVKFLNKNWETAEPWIKTIGISLGLMAAAAFPVATALGLIAIAIDDVLTWMEGGESVIGNFIEWLRGIIPGSKEVEDAIIAVGFAITAGLLAAFALAPVSLGTGLAAMFAGAFALFATPAGWAVILAGVAAALVAYFWDDLQALWAGLDFSVLGKQIGQGIVDGLLSMAGAIAAAAKSLIPNLSSGGAVMPNVPAGSGNPNAKGYNGPSLLDENPPSAMPSNLQGNLSRMQGGSGGATRVGQDNSVRTSNVNVNAPVTVQVAQATSAPSAVGGAIAGAVGRGAQPSRMQTGPAS